MNPARIARGFTLLEVLVAFVILSLALVVLAQIFSGGLRRTGDMAEYAQALSVAESALAAAGVEEAFKEGETRGETPDRRFRWSRVVKLWQDPDRDTTVEELNRVLLYQVEVRVDWQGPDGRERSFAMNTLRAGARPA
jgi:general secretion pathway protein I